MSDEETARRLLEDARHQPNAEVVAAIAAALAQARADEREACAKVADMTAEEWLADARYESLNGAATDEARAATARSIAAAIRRRNAGGERP